MSESKRIKDGLRCMRAVVAASIILSPSASKPKWLEASCLVILTGATIENGISLYKSLRSK